jgi:ribonuclease HI
MKKLKRHQQHRDKQVSDLFTNAKLTKELFPIVTKTWANEYEPPIGKVSINKDTAILSFDGGCFPNPGGRGGSGTLILHRDEMISIVSSDPSTTNNRMEIVGLMNGLVELEKKELSTVHIIGDSEYALKGLSMWAPKWEKKSWPARYKNLDLWKNLLPIWRGIQSRVDEWSFWHVPAHEGFWFNERCDSMAEDAAMHDDVTLKTYTQKKATFHEVNFSELKMLVRGGKLRSLK